MICPRPMLIAVAPPALPVEVWIAEAAIGLTGSANALAVAGPSSGSYTGGAAGLTRSRLVRAGDRVAIGACAVASALTGDAGRLARADAGGRHARMTFGLHSMVALSGSRFRPS